MIRAGDHHVIVVGGMESMSNAPYVLKKAFFFQAEDGIRVRNVTGVQTCALPISITSPPRWYIVMVLPATNGPDSSARSRSAFHSGHRPTSDQTRQTASGAAVVSVLCSVVHMSASSFQGRWSSYRWSTRRLSPQNGSCQTEATESRTIEPGAF